MQATALRRMSSMSQAQLQSKSKSLAPPDTGSGLCPQHASLLAKLGQWLCLVNETVERACQLRRLQSFEGAGMTGNVESGPVHPRFAVPKPQLASGTRPQRALESSGHRRRLGGYKLRAVAELPNSGGVGKPRIRIRNSRWPTPLGAVWNRG